MEIQKFNFKKKAFSFCNDVNILCANCTFVFFTINFFQFLTIAFILLNRHLVNIPLTQYFFNKYQSIITTCLGVGHNAYIFIVINSVILAVLILSFCTYLYFCTKSMQFNQYKKIMHVIVLTSGCVLTFLEFIVVQSIGSFSQSIEDFGYKISFFLLLIYFSNYFLFSFLSSQKRLFKNYLFLSIIMIDLWQNAFSYFIFTLIAAILLVIDNQNLFKKILYGQLVGISVWIFLGKVNNLNSGSLLPNLVLVYGVFIILTFFVIVYLNDEKLIINSNIHDNNLILSVISSIKSQKILSSIKYKTLLRIWYILKYFIEESMTQSQKSNTQVQKITKKQFTQLQKGDIIFLLKMKVQKQIQNQKDIELKMFLIKIKIIQKVSPLEIIQNVEELMQTNQKELSFLQQYRLFQFSKLIQVQIFNSKSAHLKTSIIVETSNLMEQFYYSLSAAFERLIDFWTLLEKQKISKNSIIQAYFKITKEENNAKQVLNKMSKFGKVKKQQKMLAILMNFINNYRQSRTPTDDIFVPLQTSKRLESMSYIILQQSKIVKASFSFIKEFNSNFFDYQGIDKDIIFTDIFSKFLDQEIRNMSAIQEKILKIPVLLNQNLVVKLCKLFFYPELQGKIKYLLTFQNFDKFNQQPLVLYHVRADSIQNFNNKFVQLFCLDQRALRDRIQNSKLLSSQIISKIDLSHLQSLDTLKNRKNLNCDLIVKKFKNSGPDKYKINISLVEEYNIQNDSYCLLSLKRGYFIKTDVHILGQKVSVDITNNQNDKNQKNYAKIYENQTFFCKIPNPYQNKIIEKQSQLQLPGRRNFIFYINCLFAVVVAILISQFIVTSKEKQSRMQSNKVDIAAMLTINNQYCDLFSMYYTSFKLNYITKYPEQWSYIFGDDAPNTVEYMKKYYTENMKTYIKQFLNTYMVFVHNQPNSPIHYDLKFTNFNVSTSSSTTNLIDFTQNFRLFISENTNKNSSFQFLLNNYLSFRQIAILFQQNYIYDDLINQNYFGAYSFLVFSSILIGTFSLIGCLILLRFQSNMNSVYNLLLQIEDKEIRANLKAINQQKHKIKLLKSRQELSKHQSQSDYFSKVEDQESLSLNSQRSLKQSKVQQHSQNYEQKQNEIGSMQELKQQSEFNSDQSSTKKKEFQQGLYIFLIIRNFFFVILSISFGWIIYDQVNSIIAEKKNTTAYFDYSRDLFHTIINLDILQSDNLFKPTYADYYNVNMNSSLIHSIEMPMEDMDTYFQGPLPQQFEQLDYKKLQKEILYGNICNLNITLALVIPGMKCQDYLNGMLIYGFAQAYESFLLMTKQVENLSINQFITQNCTVNNCPLYLQLLAGRYYLNQILQINLMNFQQASNEGVKIFNSNIQQKNIMYFLTVLGMIVVFILWSRMLSSRGKMTIWLFNLIPAQIMFKMKMTSYIKKQEILQKLQTL